MISQVAGAPAPAAIHNRMEGEMAKSRGQGSVYRITELVGTSRNSWEDAARNAVETAAHSLRDLRVAEVTKTDVVVENGKVVAFRARVALSFKYER
jgi:flavin-binding protein dodecin